MPNLLNPGDLGASYNVESRIVEPVERGRYSACNPGARGRGKAMKDPGVSGEAAGGSSVCSPGGGDDLALALLLPAALPRREDFLQKNIAAIPSRTARLSPVSANRIGINLFNLSILLCIETRSGPETALPVPELDSGTLSAEGPFTPALLRKVLFFVPPRMEWNSVLASEPFTVDHNSIYGSPIVLLSLAKSPKSYTE